MNLPIKNGVIMNDYRIRRSIPTILYLKKRGAKVILIAHAGAEVMSLKPIARHMNKFVRVGFIPSVTGDIVSKAVKNLPDGGIILLENLRTDPGEKGNNATFAQKLALLGDIYINDAFSVSHRKHASIMRLPKLLPSYAGLLFEEEYRNLSKARRPKKPFCFILGGAKIETKMPFIKYYLPLSKTIFIGGGPANTFFKMKGYEVGKSVVGKFIPELKSLAKNKKIILPEDVLLMSGKMVTPDGLKKEDKMVDIGSKTLNNLKNYVKGAKSVLFNGPLGIYEEGFSLGTEGLLKILAKSKAETIVGGGDTIAIITNLKMENKFTFVSTSGGAMLEFLAIGTLPGIEALKRQGC